MKSKKLNKLNLETKKVSFTLVGLAIASSLTLMSFEYRNFNLKYKDAQASNHGVIDNETLFEEVRIKTPEIKAPIIKPMPPTPIIDEIIVKKPEEEGEDKNELEIQTLVSPIIGSLSGELGDVEAPKIDSIYDIPSKNAEFKGGTKALYEYLGNTLIYPQYALDINSEGRVYVQFIVEKNGAITDAVVVRGVNKHLDNEALRVVNSMPNWNPGEQGNKKVRVRFTLPIYFKIK